MIAVNARVLHRKAMTGVERFTLEVVRRLGSRVRLISPARPLDGFAGHAWEQGILPVRLGGAALWSPANTGPLAVANQAATIHDMSVFDHPQWFAPRFAAWYRFLLPRLARRARRIITVSEFSKERIVTRLGVAASRVVVIPPGVDAARFHPSGDAEILRVQRRYQLPTVYVLAVGSLEPRKNLGKLFRAWQIVQREYPESALAVAGGAGRVHRNTGFERLPEGVRLLGHVDDADLPGLYGGAAAFVMPSVYEGFGLPVLEAMACGAPVAASRAGGLVESVGDAGLLIDPANVETMAHAICRMMFEEALRRDLIQRGFARIGAFSWEQTAERVWEALNG